MTTLRRITRTERDALNIGDTVYMRTALVGENTTGFEECRVYALDLYARAEKGRDVILLRPPATLGPNPYDVFGSDLYVRDAEVSS